MPENDTAETKGQKDSNPAGEGSGNGNNTNPPNVTVTVQVTWPSKP